MSAYKSAAMKPAATAMAPLTPCLTAAPVNKDGALVVGLWTGTMVWKLDLVAVPLMVVVMPTTDAGGAVKGTTVV